MLSAVLHGDKAIKISINIIKAFVEMRKIFTMNGQVFDRISTLEYKQIENEKKFDEIFDLMQNNESIKKSFLKGKYGMHII